MWCRVALVSISAAIALSCVRSQPAGDVPEAGQGGSAADGGGSHDASADGGARVDADAGDVCNSAGTWLVEYDSQERCWPRRSDTITVYSQDDASTDAVEFHDRGLQASNCGDNDRSSYTASILASASGCELLLSSQSTWCSHSEPQCEELELTLDIRGDSAEVTGTYLKCWCQGGFTWNHIAVHGKATRQSPATTTAAR